MLNITGITVDHLAEHIVTDNPHPVISFSIESDRENVLMSRARISIGGWSLETGEQTGIVYRGEDLKPFSAYEVCVSAGDSCGEQAAASVIFHTGRRDLPWQGSWITDAGYVFRGKKTSPVPMMFRKNFRAGEEPVCAVICSTAMGIYELTLNGRKVGKDFFAPGFTSYHHQLQYQIYDITEQLQTDNCLTVTVAGGWAVGAYTYARYNRLYADRQAFLAEIRIRYRDGRKEVIGTDESWFVTEDGPYRAAEFYDGEMYDATIDPEKISWHPAGKTGLKKRPRIEASYGVPVREHEILQPVSCLKARSGKIIYDFGQNMAGVIRAGVKGRAGQRILFEHAEVLRDGELYTEPLRTAKQQAVYICRDGFQTYQPHFTYMGFRYVAVSGIEEEDIRLSAVALYSEVPSIGSFCCSDERLNRLQKCIEWGAKSNFVDIPTDCPQRDERLGWTGDIALFAPTAAFQFDMSRFFRKWLRDVRAEQTRGGGIPMTVPGVRIRSQFEMLFPQAVDHWGDACILVPWAQYLADGDRTLLEEMYPTMKRYLKACCFWAGLGSTGRKKRIWKLLYHYGDWCAPDTGYKGWLHRGKWTATACLAHSSGIVSHIAQILGNEEDASLYADLSRETAAAYQEFLMEPDGRLKEEFQTGYVLPLYYGLLDEEKKDAAAGRLSSMVREGRYHIGTGFPGTPYVLFALAENGYEEDAFRMLLNETCPSWLYEIRAGGTTLWERWDALREDGSVNLGTQDGGSGMVSFNHYVCGSVGDFLYRRIAGIEPLEGGYRKFRCAPLTGGGITSAQGSTRTPYGTLSVRWEIKDDIFHLEAVVPTGTEGEIVLPDGNVIHTGSGRKRFQCRMPADRQEAG